jgi:hypothetical protein
MCFSSAKFRKRKKLGTNLVAVQGKYKLLLIATTLGIAQPIVPPEQLGTIKNG